MSRVTHLTAPDLVVRPYRDVDEPEVLELLRGSLGGGPAGERTPEYFRWKHLENPFGRSYMIVAESDRRIVGFRALMRWRFRVDDRTIEAVRPVDTVTHPDYRGRGIFSLLTQRALDSLKGEVDLVFNTPNLDSLPGYLKMGWQVVGQLPVSVRICRPSRFIAGRFGRARGSDEGPSNRPRIAAPTAAEVLSRERGIVGLIDRSEVASGAYATPTDVDYLRWRYGAAPLLGYHAIWEERDGALAGVVFFRARREGSVWGLVISHLLVATGRREVCTKAARAGATIRRRRLCRDPCPSWIDGGDRRPSRSQHPRPSSVHVRREPAQARSSARSPTPLVVGPVHR